MKQGNEQLLCMQFNRLKFLFRNQCNANWYIIQCICCKWKEFGLIMVSFLVICYVFSVIIWQQIKKNRNHAHITYLSSTWKHKSTNTTFWNIRFSIFIDFRIVCSKTFIVSAHTHRNKIVNISNKCTSLWKTYVFCVFLVIPFCRLSQIIK